MGKEYSIRKISDSSPPLRVKSCREKDKKNEINFIMSKKRYGEYEHGVTFIEKELKPEFSTIFAEVKKWIMDACKTNYLKFPEPFPDYCNLFSIIMNNNIGGVDANSKGYLEWRKKYYRDKHAIIKRPTDFSRMPSPKTPEQKNFLMQGSQKHAWT